MSSLLKDLLSNARKADIGYGIHTNCVITKVSNEDRKTKDGEKIRRNCYTTFSQLNDDGAVVAEKEVSWFNLDHSSEYVYSNFYNQFEQLTAIVDVFVTGKKDKWANGIQKILEENGVEVGDWDAEDPASVASCIEAITEALGDKDSCSGILEGMSELYIDLIGEKVGKDSRPVRFKVVYDNKGKYLQQPKFDAFVESMEVEEEDSRLRLTKNDEENRQKSLNLSKPKPKVSVGKL